MITREATKQINRIRKSARWQMGNDCRKRRSINVDIFEIWCLMVVLKSNPELSAKVYRNFLKDQFEGYKGGFALWLDRYKIVYSWNVDFSCTAFHADTEEQLTYFLLMCDP